ncbi:MAG: DUF309 domain-containing protein [Candidatus Acidiferrales bacterium]
MTNSDKFQRGVSLFNSGDFFLAHEVWEEIWMDETEPEKTFLQGMIQAAAAFHHYQRGNLNGAESLLASAATKLRRVSARHEGIAVGPLLADVIWWARTLGEGNDPGTDKLPHIVPG